MVGIFRSLRFRLVTMFVVIVGLMQVVLSIAGLLVGEHHLRDQFDQDLLQRSEGMAAELAQSQRKLFGPDVADVVRDQALSAIFRNFYVQLRDSSGKLIQRSANLRGYQLPFIAAGSSDGRARLDTVTGPEVQQLVGNGRRLRMVTRAINEPNREPMILQVAASLQQVDASVRQLWALLILGVPVGLTAAAVASWVVIDRAVRKISAVSALAQRVQPGKPAPRLEVANTSDEIGQMVEHVNAMLERLETGFVAQDRFIHDASHELKTPLSTLLSEAQVLKMMKPTAEQCRLFIDSVEQETRHLAKLTDSLLILARSDGDKRVLAQEVASINDVTEAAVQECQAVAKQRGVKLVLRLAEPDEVLDEMTFRGDGSLVGVMVSNLVRNAISFSQQEQEVEVEVSRRGSSAVIEVRDHGPGVPPEAIDRIFDRFVQADNGAPRRGSGLGLSIARSIARLHGGDIQVTNLKAGGCAFSASVPVLTDNQPTD